LNFSADAGTNGTTDISWTYNVSALPGFLLSDVLLSLTGIEDASGRIEVSETFIPNVLPNGLQSLKLLDAGSVSAVFSAPVAALGALKDQFNSNRDVLGDAETSILVNAYSVAPVPIPGAALLLGSSLAFVGGFGAWRRRRREDAPALA